MESSKGGLPDSWEYFGSFKVIDEHNLYLGFLRWIVHLYQFSKPIAFFSGFWYAYIMRVWLFYTPDHLNVSFTSTSYISRKEPIRKKFRKLSKHLCLEFFSLEHS